MMKMLNFLILDDSFMLQSHGEIRCPVPFYKAFRRLPQVSWISYWDEVEAMLEALDDQRYGNA